MTEPAEKALITHGEFTALAENLGFKKVFFLEPMRFELGENLSRLVDDAKARFPFADSIAVLVYPYAPYTADELIPAYYPASNTAYHAMRALIDVLRSRGIRAEKCEIPVKPALELAGIGVGLKNSLRSITHYGSRFVLMMIAVEGIPPMRYDARERSYCEGCHACENACPAGAIGRDGLDLSRCFRLRMETADHPDEVRDHQRTYIGCEICQYACPMNAGLRRAEPSPELRAAFDIRALAGGSTKAARLLVGKNMTGGGRLTAEALAFAARDGLIEEEELNAFIAQAEESPFEAVRSAAAYARDRLVKRSKDN